MYEVLGIVLICGVLCSPFIWWIWGGKLPTFIHCPRCSWGASHIVRSEKSVFYIHDQNRVCQVDVLTTDPQGENRW